jgi:hypothetical protein
MKASPLLLSAILALSFGTARAHHSFPAVYDPAQLVTVAGVVTRLDLTNPHANIYLAVRNSDGSAEDWRIEMPGKLSLVRRGWTDETLVPGDAVTAIGHPSLTGEPAMWWQRVQLADGTEYLAPSLADQLAVEAQRRERARQASQ